MLRNRYRPMKRLSATVFGKTYLAQDIDRLNQKCIIKQFAPHINQVKGTAGLEEVTELFEQEAIRLQKLGEYPQIPSLLDYFKADSHLYLIEEFIDGQNLLEELLEQEAFSEEKIRDLLENLLNLLKVVHQHKVIHWNIKPENIIQGGDGKVVLIDFGTFKQLTKTAIARKETMIASFGYTPLEQIKGGEAYPTSDLFSLGATCFHLLSGIDPSELWMIQGYAWVNSWEQHLQQRLSQELRKIIDKLLQVDYQQRYQSVEEVLEDLNLPSQSISTKNTADYYNEGIEKYNNQDYQEAIEDFTQAIKINSNYAEAYLKRGNARYYLGDYQGTIEDYNQAIIINPNYAEAYNSRGCARYSSGDPQEAIKDFTQAIEINPNYAKAYSNRGNARSYLGDYQAAIEDCNQAIKINPNHATAYNNRGNAHSDFGDYQEAIEDYNQAIKINPNYVHAYFNRGFALDELEDYQAAIKDYTQAIKINPDYADAYNNRGLVRSKLEDKQEAIEDFRQAADLYKQQGQETDYQNALNHIKQLEKKDYYNEAIEKYNKEDFDGAIENLTQVIKIDIEDAEAYSNRGNAYYRLGDYQAAIEDFCKAADLYKQKAK